MCDYSLTGIPNRLAVAGEDLTTHRFQTGTVGMVSVVDKAKLNCFESKRTRPNGIWAVISEWLAGPPVSEPLCAVCIPPGTGLMMSRIPEAVRRQFALSEAEEVTFTQLTAEAFRHRDAIRFRNGRHLLLQSLPDGVLFQVQHEFAGHSVADGANLDDRAATNEIRRIPA